MKSLHNRLTNTNLPLFVCLQQRRVSTVTNLMQTAAEVIGKNFALLSRIKAKTPVHQEEMITWWESDFMNPSVGDNPRDIFTDRDCHWTVAWNLMTSEHPEIADCFPTVFKKSNMLLPCVVEKCLLDIEVSSREASSCRVLPSELGLKPSVCVAVESSRVIQAAESRDQFYEVFGNKLVESDVVVIMYLNREKARNVWELAVIYLQSLTVFFFKPANNESRIESQVKIRQLTGGNRRKKCSVLDAMQVHNNLTWSMEETTVAAIVDAIDPNDLTESPFFSRKNNLIIRM